MSSKTSQNAKTVASSGGNYPVIIYDKETLNELIYKLSKHYLLAAQGYYGTEICVFKQSSG